MCSDFAYSELMRPSTGGENKEILIINSKQRLYYNVHDNGLTYSINGPRRMELIGRYPSKSRRRKARPFGYTIVIDNQDTIYVNHSYQVNRRLRSVQRPNLYFTYSGNYFFNLSSGRHDIQILPGEEQKLNTLIRVLGKEFNGSSDQRRNLMPAISHAPKHINSGNREIDYYELTHANPLQVMAEGPGTLKITSRLAFETWMGSRAIYRISVKEGIKVIGTYYFTAEPSAVSTIVEKPEWIPGKWRTCEIPIPDGRHIFDINLLENDRTVFLRFTEYR